MNTDQYFRWISFLDCNSGSELLVLSIIKIHNLSTISTAINAKSKEWMDDFL